jgi:hypothetical protein
VLHLDDSGMYAYVITWMANRMGFKIVSVQLASLGGGAEHRILVVCLLHESMELMAQTVSSWCC